MSLLGSRGRFLNIASVYIAVIFFCFLGTNLLQATAHELGHSFGLGHSDDSNAVMAPFYRGYSPSFGLGEDDIDAIRVLYGISGDDLELKTNWLISFWKLLVSIRRF